ncbi:hypothetical protein CRUP_031629 [Coryphaenoides rupestris]|nr:hypothetical protein CRUP_031629 [Coryphaenoides rupestris]
MLLDHGGGGGDGAGVASGVGVAGAGGGVEVDEYFFLQPLSTRRRRALLRASGVRRIDGEERHQLRALRGSREECGCRCRGACDPETCACSLAGIKCQAVCNDKDATVSTAALQRTVDRMSFPCAAPRTAASNAPTPGVQPGARRTHFLHTIMKLS